VVHQVSQQLQALMDPPSIILPGPSDKPHADGGDDEVADQSQTGVDPKVLIRTCERARQGDARAAKLERTRGEIARAGYDRDSLNKSEEPPGPIRFTGCRIAARSRSFFVRPRCAAMEKDEALSVLLIDIDYFKKFNDNFGHASVTRCFDWWPRPCANLVRGEDLPARYGGEELIAVSSRTELATCGAIAERIRRSIADCQFTRRSTGEILPQITVSIGRRAVSVRRVDGGPDRSLRPPRSISPRNPAATGS